MYLLRRNDENLCFKVKSSFQLYTCVLLAAREDPEWILVEKDRFVNDYDKDHDGKLNPQELLSWIVPNNQGIAQEEVGGVTAGYVLITAGEF